MIRHPGASRDPMSFAQFTGAQGAGLLASSMAPALVFAFAVRQAQSGFRPRFPDGGQARSFQGEVSAVIQSRYGKWPAAISIAISSGT
ncbi:MAG: hypothetical protein KGI62_08090, partial [Xanthomonadaceae bacterium]|nr:hypothetical protein [Xanthomonadaceae bacterium]